MKKYINFDVMITPTIIKILFWVGVAGSIIFGLITSFSGLGMMFSRFASTGAGFATFIFGFFIMLGGILITRIYCELIIIAFKMVEKLNSIDEKLDRKSDSFNINE